MKACKLRTLWIIHPQLFFHGNFFLFFCTQGLIVTLVRSLTSTGLTLYHYHTLGAWEKHVFAVDTYFHTLLNYF